MTHFSIEGWTDFIRGLVAAPQREAMQRHLNDCPACRRQCDLLRAVVEMAARDVDVPPDVFARAAAIVPRTPPLRSLLRPLAAILQFDSFASTAAAGVRGGETPTRHLVFTAEECRVELLISAGGPEQLLLVTGQVSLSDSTHGASAPVVLLKGKRVLQRVAANERGEFQLESPPQSGLRLRIIDNLRGRSVEVALPTLT